MYAFAPENVFSYFQSKGFNTYRLPFRHERMIASPGASVLTSSYATLYDGMVKLALAKGAYPIIDPHNFGRYRVGASIVEDTVVGGTEVIIGQDAAFTPAQFGNNWGLFSDRWSDPRCMYNLMNEPQSQLYPDLKVTLNAGISGIRSRGHRNLILVPFNSFSNRFAFVNEMPQQVDLLNGIVDPLNNWAIDYHCYVDEGSSGQTTNVQAGFMDSVLSFTEWCRANGRKAFCGEFGTASDAASLAAAASFLGHVKANRDVWLGFAWWTAVMYQPDYPFQLMPPQLTNAVAAPEPPPYTDRPQMAVILA